MQADTEHSVTNNLYIAPSTFEKLAAHPNIVGTKLSHGIIDDQTLIAASPKIDHDHFYVFTGLGQNLLPVLAIGGVAAIDGLAGVFPRTVVRLFDLFNQGLEKGMTQKDMQEMRTVQFRICEGEKIVARVSRNQRILDAYQNSHPRILRGENKTTHSLTTPECT